jgi:hypothetical protein
MTPKDTKLMIKSVILGVTPENIDFTVDAFYRALYRRKK